MSYYLSKVFVITKKASTALNSVLLRLKKKHIHSINICDSDSIMICSNPITAVENNLKKIYLGGYLLVEFTSTYYDDKNDTFGLLFQQYTASAVENIYHPSIVK